MSGRNHRLPLIDSDQGFGARGPLDYDPAARTRLEYEFVVDELLPVLLVLLDRPLVGGPTAAANGKSGPRLQRRVREPYGRGESKPTCHV